MNNLFSAHWNHAKGSPRRIDCLPPSGFGRLLAAVAVIGIAVSALDHAAAGKVGDNMVIAYSDTVIAHSDTVTASGDTGIAYGSSDQGSVK